MALPPRIHILGLGSVGQFTAHTLAEIPKRPPITLLMHRKSLLEEFNSTGRQITIQENNGNRFQYGNYDVEYLHENAWFKAAQPNTLSDSPITSKISHLILCVKTPQTVAALRSLERRLSPQSTILFLQNGSGMVEAVNEQLYTDPVSRPNYITGVISHGMSMQAPFEVIHSGPAYTALGLVPRTDGRQASPDASYMLRVLPESPRLKARSYPYPEALQLQLEKLTINSFTNPNAALANKPNSYLSTIPDLRDALLKEISTIVRALPELEGIHGVYERFSPEKLVAVVNSLLEKVQNTIGSMVWDVRKKQKTEIDFLNGYWAKRGRELGIPTPVNDDIIAKIKAKESSYLETPQ